MKSPSCWLIFHDFSTWNPHSITISSDEIHDFPRFSHDFPIISRILHMKSHQIHCQLVAAVAAAPLFRLLSREPGGFFAFNADFTVKTKDT